jgi:hypothetical protein
MGPLGNLNKLVLNALADDSQIAELKLKRANDSTAPPHKVCATFTDIKAFHR